MTFPSLPQNAIKVFGKEILRGHAKGYMLKGNRLYVSPAIVESLLDPDTFQAAIKALRIVDLTHCIDLLQLESGELAAIHGEPEDKTDWASGEFFQEANRFGWRFKSNE